MNTKTGPEEDMTEGAVSELNAGLVVNGCELDIPSEMAEQARDRIALRREMLAAGVKFEIWTGAAVNLRLRNIADYTEPNVRIQGTERSEVPAGMKG